MGVSWGLREKHPGRTIVLIEVSGFLAPLQSNYEGVGLKCHKQSL